MCGIFGYVSDKPLNPDITLEGLRTLEYRGYDSWGIVSISPTSKLKVIKKTGKISQASVSLPDSTTCIGHTRWATHGGVTIANAHPHLDCNSRFGVIHNGIIENDELLKKKLGAKGHIFKSQTDTEVIPHLLEELSRKENNLLTIASKCAKELKGAFAFCFIDAFNPVEIILVRYGGPLVIGTTHDATYFASDASALMHLTKNVTYLKDGEIAVLTPGKILVHDFERNELPTSLTKLDWGVKKLDKGKFENFMLKEIFEQPIAIRSTLRGRVDKKGKVRLGGLEEVNVKIRDIGLLRFVGSGSTSYAAIYGSLICQNLTPILSTFENSSEMAYQCLNWVSNSASLFISQSGETADMLKAMDSIDRDEVLKLGLVNSVGSTIARKAEAGVYLHIGPEVAVASTKAFTSQLVCLLLINIYIAQNHSRTSKHMRNTCAEVLRDLKTLDKKVALILKNTSEIEKLARILIKAEMISFFGRGYCYPIALEAALKLKEIAYLNSIGLQTGDLKHGSIAAMDKKRPAVIFVSNDEIVEKSISNIKELKARNIPVYVITVSSLHNRLSKIADKVLAVPNSNQMITPILFTIVAQLLAYESAILLKRSIDKPRNLAKSVTVE